MANRLFNQFRLQLEKQVVDLFGQFTVAGAGVPTLVAAKSKGIASVTRLGAGQYSIVLQDTYLDLLMMNIRLLSTAASASPDCRVVSQAVANVASKAIVIEFTVGGVATDPADGETVLFSPQLKNSGAY